MLSARNTQTEPGTMPHPQSQIDLQSLLVQALIDPGRYPERPDTVEHLETHISHVFLAGEHAYKIKKPLNLGFLDFSDLQRRRHFCFEELRLNRRLAPSLYLDCIPIRGSAENPVLGGDDGEIVEWAVRMRRFPQEALLDRVLARGALRREHIDALARSLARFHRETPAVGADQPYGEPEAVAELALDNFRLARPNLDDADDLAALARLEGWTRAEIERLRPAFAQRKREGFVRECHADPHLGNVVLDGDAVTIFDCVEFSPRISCSDTMADLGFTYMDLCQRGATALAHRLVNVYLEHSGDYGALEVFPFYACYRAMVRAMVASIRLRQLAGEARAPALAEFRAYLRLAEGFTRPAPPLLLITHGVSGSGKSTATAAILEAFGAVRLRSDVERKRLYGLGPLEASGSAVGGGIYTAQASARTYARLEALAAMLLGFGVPVLVDATFPEREGRERFAELAASRGVPFVVLVCAAAPEALRARVAARAAGGTDAAEADLDVLERQLARYAPPAADEPVLAAGDDPVAALRHWLATRTG